MLFVVFMQMSTKDQQIRPARCGLNVDVSCQF